MKFLSTGPELQSTVQVRRAPHRRAGILGVLVAGYVALIPYLFEVERGLNFAPADCVLLLMLLLTAGQLKYVEPAWSVWHFGILLLFALGTLVSALRFGGLDRYELLNKDAGLLLTFVSYAAITSTITEWEDLRRILRVFTWSVVLENAVALGGFFATYFFGVATPFTLNGGLRLCGMLLDPNAYGGLLVVALVICEGSSWGEAPLFRGPALWFSRTTLALGILFTFSRSAWIALALSLLLLCVVRTRVAVRLMLAMLIAVPCLVPLMRNNFLAVFEEMARRPEQVQERFDLIDAALRLFAIRPFLGGGLGSFRMSVGSVAHNSAMWFLADFGIVGLAVLLGFLAWFFAKAWFAFRHAPERERPLVLAVLLAHMAMLGLAMGIEAFYQRDWWLSFALIASAYSLTAPRARYRVEVAGYVQG